MTYIRSLDPQVEDEGIDLNADPDDQRDLERSDAEDDFDGPFDDDRDDFAVDGCECGC